MASWVFMFAMCITVSFATIGSHYRGDIMLSEHHYPEDFSHPSGGGRVHYTIPSSVAYAAAEMPYTVQIKVNGNTRSIKLASDGSLPKELNWIHADLSSAGILWVSLHSNSDSDLGSISHIKVTDNKKQTLCDVDLTILVKDYDVKTTYVTTTNNFTTLVVHVHNDNKDTQTINDIIVDGASTGTKVTMGTNEHRVFTFPTKKFEGAVWTVNLEMSDGTLVGNGGRIGKELFPMMVWQHSEQCPFPSTNATNFQTYTQDFDLNSFLLTKGYECNGDALDILKDAPSHNYTLFADASYDDTDKNPSPLASLTDGIAAIFAGDEVDGNVDNAERQWQTSMQFRSRLPSQMTYQGGKTYSWCGTFAGITDIQGKDFYIAGCAPHITSATSTMRIQGSLDYIKNTRDNHMPLTVWAYSQFIHSWDEQPNSNEIMVQIASVVAGGSKGLMLFQIDPSYKGSSWLDAVSGVLKPLQLLGEEFRVGDIMGAVFDKDDSDDESTVAVVRSLDKLVVIVINTNVSGYNDLTCYAHISDHWNFKSHTISKLKITLPSDLQNLSKIQQVDSDGYGEAKDVDFEKKSGEVELKNIKLGEDPTCVRFFVIS